ncbi:hypothetical protein ACFLS9_07520 [Bacteroidota bacterium]
MRSIYYLFCIFLLMSFFNACTKNNDDNQKPEKQDSSQNSGLSETSGIDSQGISQFDCDYLGQEFPRGIPQKFAPEVFSTNQDESCFEISASGKEILFNREGKIYIVKQDQNGKWSSPASLPFPGGETSFSKDSNYIYFNSRTSFPGAKVPLNVWRTQKLNEQWNEPNHLGEPVINQTVHAPSVASNGNIYASGIIRLKFVDGKYQPPEQLTPVIKGSHPFISSDESFLIFDKRPQGGGNAADLFITFRKSDDTWTDPVGLGDNINTSAMETNAYVTPDEKYMFFTRKFDIYWVSANFIAKNKKSYSWN